jgi:hypothetical protein
LAVPSATVFVERIHAFEFFGIGEAARRALAKTPAAFRKVQSEAYESTPPGDVSEEPEYQPAVTG